MYHMNDNVTAWVCKTSYLNAFHCIGIKLPLLLDIACVHKYVCM